MNEKVRIQVLEDSDEHDWADVGNKSGDQSVPVNIKDNPPTDIINNASFSYDVSGTSCTITQTVGAVDYQKTIDWSANPITESGWV